MNDEERDARTAREDYESEQDIATLEKNIASNAAAADANAEYWMQAAIAHINKAIELAEKQNG